MPEGLEAEIWRRAAVVLVGRRITSLWCDQRVAPEGLSLLLSGATITGVDRAGKVVQIVTDAGVLGLHLGMTGRLEIDGAAPIGNLAYASAQDRAAWDRLHLTTEPSRSAAGRDVPALRMNDPRRLGRLSLDEPPLIGPDAMTLTAAALQASLAARSAPIKTLLLDQWVVAGLGNLCADEVLFWADVAPHRGARELGDDEIAAIARACREQLPLMLADGGSTHGALTPEVRALPMPCPRDGNALERTRIAGRTAVWCPAHQL